MPACMTSELRELVPVPMASVASATRTSRPDRARARATARPTTPAPTTMQSMSVLMFQGCSFGWLVGGRQVEAAGVEHQRGRGAVAATLYLAHHDDVVAFDIAAAIAAFEPRGARGVQHGRAAGRVGARQAVKAFAGVPQRKAPRQPCLARRQHIDHVTLAMFEDLEPGRLERQ